MRAFVYTTILLVLAIGMLHAQDTIRYTGSTLVNVDYHHGQLSPAVGVHNIQTFRANRASATNNWTYNHAPMLAYWRGKFYLEYLSNPVGEHVPPGQTLLQSSIDGYHWSDPVVIFPPYKIPDGTTKEGRTEVAHNLMAVMHQRIGFYTAKSGKLFALAFYGMVMGPHDDPNDGNGIGRVIREVKEDGSYGPIYFLRYNHAFNASNTSYPFYKTSKDKDVVAACEEILASPLLMQQMVEENDRNDPLIPLKKDFKAFNYYRLPNGEIVGLWKYALTSITTNGGKTWQYNPTRAPGFVNANAKIWGQRTSDGHYATVYNPSEFRWPLAVSTSADGLHYTNLLLVNGEISSLRYGGAYKSYGPQYVRGIQEMNGTPPDGNLWVTYSMNKEDIWISKIPIPVTDTVAADCNDDFAAMKANEHTLDRWNIFSPALCRVTAESTSAGTAVTLHDSDPFDYAKAERVFPETDHLQIAFSITAAQTDHGELEIEIVDRKGTPCMRLMFDSTGSVSTKAGYHNRKLADYKKGEPVNVRVDLNVKTRFYTCEINGKKSTNLCFAPVSTVDRIVFRTGATRRFPDADTPTDQDYDLPDPSHQDVEAIYYINYLKTGVFVK